MKQHLTPPLQIRSLDEQLRLLYERRDLMDRLIRDLQVYLRTKPRKDPIRKRAA